MQVDPAYAPYVWSAYGVSAAVLLWMTADSLVRARKWRRAAESRREERP